ncbi:MAG: beta-N-acetylhexosaminidase [Deltaproteobacteria bacterium]|nr:beta-N-acetylhexosaminidase [Deltaproteobacteria bacterium]
MNTTLDLSEVNPRVGQLFMVGMPGPQMDEDTRDLIRDYNVGGVVLFSRNIEGPIQLTTLCQDLQDTAMEFHGIPLILAIDQEGGRVSRLKEPFTQFPGNTVMGQDTKPIEKAMEFGRVTAKELKLVGLNMNFAPVLDVQRGEPEKHLQGRTFGEDVKKVSRLGKTVVRSLQEHGILAVAKHFPGLGRSSVDPHFDLPRIEIDMKEMEQVNLPPFQVAINVGVSGIMTSHAIYPALDPERPATLSPAILTQLLREKMGFEGLIITDDLEMGAIAKHWGIAEGAANAFEAGADILLICEDQRRVLEGIELLRGRLLQGEISSQRLDQSNERIMRLRSDLLDRREWVMTANIKEYFNL